MSLRSGYDAPGGAPSSDWDLPPAQGHRLAGTDPAPEPQPAPASVDGPPGPQAGAERRTHRRRWWGLGVITLSQMLIVLDATIVNVALPAMAADLEITDADRAWVVTTYTIAFGGLLLLGGRVADYLGLRRTFAIGLVGFGVASALGGAATNMEMLFVARAMQGIFGALMAPSALALVATMFRDPAERSKAFAIFGAVAGGGSAVGLVLGGVLTEYANWRWTMFINVPFVVIALIGAYLLLDEVRGDHPGRLDVTGAVLGTGGLVAVVYSFSEAERNGWTEPLTLTLLGSGIALLILFVVSQRVVSNPILPPRILANRTRLGSNVAVMLGMVGMFGAFFFLTFYLQGVLEFGPTKTGVAFLPVTGGVILASAVVSGVLPKIRPRWLMGPGLLGAAVGMFLLMRIEPDSNYWSDVFPALLLMGLSLGSVFVPAFNAATFDVAPQDAGVASATPNTAQQVGGSLGVALLSSVAANRTADWLDAREDSPENLVAGIVEGYARASLWAGVILTVAAVITFVLVNVRRLELSPAAEVETPAAGDQDALEMPRRYADYLAADPASSEQPTAGWFTAEPAHAPGIHADPVGYADDYPDPVYAGAGLDGHPAAGAAAPGPVFAAAPAVFDSAPTPAPTPAAERAARAPAGEWSVPVGGAGGGPVLRGTVRGTAGPLPGATLTLLDTDGRQVARGQTGGLGTFEFGVPAAGELVLVAHHVGHHPVAVTVHAVERGPGSHLIEVEVTLTGAARLTGVVVSAGLRRAPVRDALVTLTDSAGDVVASTRTDALGDYEITGLLGGAFTLVVSAPTARPVAVPVHLGAEAHIRQDVEIAGTATISGVARTAAGGPVADVQVTLTDAGGIVVSVSRTDAEGRYAFGDLAEGSYTVRATGYAPTTAQVGVGAGESVDAGVEMAHHHVEVGRPGH